MDYFNPQALEPGGGNGDADDAGPGGDSYFSSSSSSNNSNNNSYSNTPSPILTDHPPTFSNANAVLGPPTMNPFKLSNPAHPTIVPTQNGATAGFQHALLQRRSQTVPSSAPFSSFISTTALPLHHHMEGSNATTFALTRGVSSPGRIQKRHHHPPSHASTNYKSVRTPVISSPRKIESHSPASSTSSTSSTESHEASSSTVVPTPSVSASASIASQRPASFPMSFSASNIKLPQFPINTSNEPSIKSTPKLSLSAATPSGLSRASTIPVPLSATSLRAHNSPVRGMTTSSCGTAGASTVATAMRRGTAVVNQRFTTLVIPEDLSALLTGKSLQSVPMSSASYSSLKQATSPLILDLRPHTAFVAQGRLRGSINVCVPSTLLRRPNFGLAKIAETLTSKRDRSLFSKALNLNSTTTSQDASQVNRIIILDQESTFLSTDSIINSLLAKLEREGFKGELEWIKGGFSALHNYLEDHEDAALAQVVDWHTLSEAEMDSSEDEAEGEEGDQRMDGVDHQHDHLHHGTVQDPAQSSSPKPIVPGRSSSSSASSGSTTSGLNSQGSTFPSSLASSQTSIDEEGMDPEPRLQSQSSGTSMLDHRTRSLPQMKIALPRKTSMPSDSSLGAGVTSSTGDALDTNTGSAPVKASSNPVIRPKNLPMSAFQFGSTAAYSAASETDPSQSTTAATDSSSSLLSSNKGNKKPRSSKFLRSPIDGLQNLASSVDPAATARSKSTMTQSGHRGQMRTGGYGFGFGFGQTKQAANPFFDNIRQNIEVSTGIKLMSCFLGE